MIGVIEMKPLRDPGHMGLKGFKVSFWSMKDHVEILLNLDMEIQAFTGVFWSSNDLGVTEQ